MNGREEVRGNSDLYGERNCGQRKNVCCIATYISYDSYVPELEPVTADML